MEEFSFKPISKGLGFHKNQLKIDEKALRDIHWKKEVELPEIDFQENEESGSSQRNSSTSSWESDSSLGQTVTSYRRPKFDLLDEGINVEQVKKELEQKAMLSKTLPRNDIKKEAKAFVQKTTQVSKEKEGPKLEKNLDSIRDLEKRIEESKVQDVLQAKEMQAEEKVSGNWFAAIVDFVAVFGMINMFMACLLFVTKLDVFAIVKNNYTELMTQVSLIVMFVGISFLYTVVTRSFFSMTLGDWSLDMQLGNKEQRSATLYPIRVALRFLVAALTGFILLPILSVLFRRDLLGLITGLNLYRLKE